MGNVFFLRWANLVTVVFQRVSQFLAPNNVELVHLCSAQKVNKQYDFGINIIIKDCL